MLLMAAAVGCAASAQTVADPAAVIQKIEVEGTQRVEQSTVISYLTVHVGDRFDPREINESLKKLFATGFFATVELFQAPGQNVLVVRVKENPIVNQVAFEGNKRIDDNALQAETQLRPRSIYTRAKIQADVQRIADIYRRSGRYGAKIEPKLIRLDQNRVDVAFEIDEGPLTSVSRIVFIGNKRFSDSTLRGEITTSETAWWRFYTSSDVFDPDRITFDEEKLRRFYLEEGYADFRVVSSVSELTPERDGFVVTFTIEEGERYRVGKVDITSELPEVPAENLLPSLAVAPGDWYDASAVDKDVDIVTDYVAERGFAFVQVRPNVVRDRDNLTVNLTYTIGEGPRVYVNRIDIEGNVRTKDKVLRREFRLAEGDAYSVSKVRRSKARLDNLGFFESVEIKNLPADQPDRVDLQVKVKEKSTGEISFGAGFSTNDGILGDIGIRERNLLGKGQDLRLRLQLSARRQQVDLGFTEPYFLDRELAAGFDVFHIQEDNTDESSFQSNTTGGRVRAGYSFSEHLSQTWAYTLRADDIRPANNASPYIMADGGKSSTSSISHTLSYDNRDNRFSPTRGYVVSLTNEVAGLGGSKRYVRNRANAGVYYSIVPDLVVSALGQAGHIFGIGQGVNINDRFTLGGDSFRGFQTAGIGPRDITTNDSLGGNFYSVGTLELSFPLGLPDEFAIHGRVFAEAGMLTGADEDGLPGVASDSAIRATIGIGASWTSPFGPIRVDFGYPVLKENYDKTQFFHFSFGTRF
jgi:outer membrane protein insertion porin family